MMSVEWIRRFSPRRTGPEAYLHLVWLIFLFAQPGFDPNATWLDWALVPVLILIFMPVYMLSWMGNVRQRYIAVFLLVFLAMLSVPLNSGASSLFIYASAAIAATAPPRRALTVILGIALLVPISVIPIGIPWPYTLFYVIPIMLMTVIIGIMNVYEAGQRQSNRRLRLAHDEIERLAKIAERERIARDLHDLLGHTLSMITLKSELAARLTERDPSRATREMKEVEEISREALAEVRAAVRGYRSKGLSAQFDEAVRSLESAGIAAQLDVGEFDLQPAQESTLELVLREAVTNVIRHSDATRSTIRLRQTTDHVRLEISDDGVGGVPDEGSGLRGMRDRVEAAGGELERDGNEGTTLRVTLPRGLHRKEERAVGTVADTVGTPV